MLHSNRTFIIYKKTYLRWFKRERNGSNLTIGKYHINISYHILNYFQWKFLCTSVLNFPWLTILLFYKRRPFCKFGQFRRLFKEKKEERKNIKAKVAKSCHQMQLWIIKFNLVIYSAFSSGIFGNQSVHILPQSNSSI